MPGSSEWGLPGFFRSGSGFTSVDMTKQKRRVSERMIFVCFMLASLIVLFSPESLTSRLQFAFARLFHWPLSFGTNVTLMARSGVSEGEFVSRREYERLSNHLSSVEMALERERKRVEQLSGLRTRFGLDGAGLVGADVTTLSLEGAKAELMINRGRDDGVQPGYFVLGDNSVVGTISAAGARTSRVRLLTDGRSKIPVRIEGMEVGGVLEGEGGGSARLGLISAKYDVEVGDSVFAYKPGVLDLPIVAGVVTASRKDDERPLLLDIRVAPACRIEELGHVHVLIMNPER